MTENIIIIGEKIMRKKNYLYIIICLAIALSFVLTGCGGAAEPEAPAEEAEEMGRNIHAGHVCAEQNHS